MSSGSFHSKQLQCNDHIVIWITCLRRLAKPEFTFLHAGARGQSTALGSAGKQLFLLPGPDRWNHETAEQQRMRRLPIRTYTASGDELGAVGRWVLAQPASLRLSRRGFGPAKEPSPAQSPSSPWELTGLGMISEMRFFGSHLFTEDRSFNAMDVARL